MKRYRIPKMFTVAGLALALGAPLARSQAVPGEVQPLPRSDTRTLAGETGGERGQLSGGDYKFLMDAARGGQAEVDMGELAKQNGGIPPVRTLGERMVTDHTKANAELRQIAAQKQAVVPAEISTRDRSEYDRLQKLTGREFDSEYTRALVKDHKKDLAMFQQAAKSLDDPDLRDFAQRTALVIQEHLRQAEKAYAMITSGPPPPAR